MFVVLGVVIGTLAGRMPDLKAQADLTDGALGIALVGVPVGSLLAIQLTARVISAFGSGPVTRCGSVVMGLAVLLLPLAHGLVGLLGALLVLGAGVGLTDTAMNAQAVTVERGLGRRIMSSMHACASLGMLLGALGATLAVRLGWGIGVHVLVVAVVGVAAAAVAGLGLLPGAADAHSGPTGTADGKRRHPWTATLVLLSATALLAWLTEHAMADWSAVYLRDGLGSGPVVATVGYAAFTVAMVAMRLLGDAVTTHLGAARVLRLGGLVVGAGLGGGLLSDTVAGTIAGFGLVGIGMAVVVPITFTEAGNLPDVPPARAVSRLAGTAYTGSLLGPPLVGWVAEATSLRTALLLLAAGCVAIGIASPRAVGHR